jgi:hypothetical protein
MGPLERRLGRLGRLQKPLKKVGSGWKKARVTYPRGWSRWEGASRPLRFWTAPVVFAEVSSFRVMLIEQAQPRFTLRAKLGLAIDS